MDSASAPDTIRKAIAIPPPTGSPMDGLPSGAASVSPVRLNGGTSCKTAANADHCGSVSVISSPRKAAGRAAPPSLPLSLTDAPESEPP